MNKTILAAAASVAVLAVAGLGVLSLQSHSKQTSSPPPAIQVSQKQQIKFSDGGKTVAYNGQANKAALAVMQSLTNVETQTSSYGDFVTSINGFAATEGSEYWAFYVNGKLSDTGAGTYQTSPTDKIEWRLTKI